MSFNGLKSFVLKLQCLKTRDHATDVVPRLGTSSSFCPGGWSFSTCFCLPFTPRGGQRIKIAVTKIFIKNNHLDIYNMYRIYT